MIRILLEIQHQRTNDEDDTAEVASIFHLFLSLDSPMRIAYGIRVGSLCLACAIAVFVRADELHLKNGLILTGTALTVPGLNNATAHRNLDPNNPANTFWMVDDGVRRYFVSRRQVADQIDNDELARTVSYEVDRETRSRTTGPSAVGAFAMVEPFDQYGRRTVKLRTSRGIVPIVQEITELRPDRAKVESLTHVWEFHVDTDSLPLDVIQGVIEQASDRNDPAERRGAVLFFIQAEMYPAAEQELSRMAEEFPEEAEWCQRLQSQILDSRALRGINEIQRRRDAGQHQLAYFIASKFPDDRLSSSVHRQARDIVADYQAAVEDRDRVVMLLDTLQAELDRELADQLRPLRAKLIDELHYETLPRLEPFLRSELDDTLIPAQKLALAYTGWILGNAHATLDIKEAIRLWEMRFLAQEYLRADPNPENDQERLDRFSAIEGVSVARLAQMVPQLPLPFAVPDAKPGQAIEIDATTGAEQAPLRYTLMLPPEYSPHHTYPLLVALRGEGRSFRETVHWWAGDKTRQGWAQRRGYIVIAPHYCSDEATDHDYSTQSHHNVVQSIGHVRKRFRVDSDRIFIAGHGMGGDACYDIAMSHPDLFAGAIPITAIIEKYSLFSTDNAPHVHWYIVAGQRDRDSLDRNAGALNRMMRRGHDVLYCEFKERGFEPYQEEQDRIFEWMQPLTRVRLQDVAEFEVGGLRKSDNAFYWMRGDDLPDSLYRPIVWESRSRKIPRKFDGHVTPGGAIYVSHPGRRTSIWLAPELFDFDNRCKVRVNGRTVLNDYIEPSAEALLNDLRDRGDRERLYWARLDL